MRFLIQRVAHAAVEVEGRTIGSIGKGFLVFVGISGTDTEAIADKMVGNWSGSGYSRMRMARPTWISKQWAGKC